MTSARDFQKSDAQLATGSLASLLLLLLLFLKHKYFMLLVVDFNKWFTPHVDRIDTVKAAFESQKYTVTVVDNKQELLAALVSAIPDGASVGQAGSTTLMEIGWSDYCRAHPDKWNNLHAKKLAGTRDSRADLKHVVHHPRLRIRSGEAGSDQRVMCRLLCQQCVGGDARGRVAGLRLDWHAHWRVCVDRQASCACCRRAEDRQGFGRGACSTRRVLLSGVYVYVCVCVNQFVCQSIDNRNTGRKRACACCLQIAGLENQPRR